MILVQLSSLCLKMSHPCSASSNFMRCRMTTNGLISPFDALLKENAVAPSCKPRLATAI